MQAPFHRCKGQQRGWPAAKQPQDNVSQRLGAYAVEIVLKLGIKQRFYCVHLFYTIVEASRRLHGRKHGCACLRFPILSGAYESIFWTTTLMDRPLR